MIDNHHSHPSASLSFILDKVKSNAKIIPDSHICFGTTHTFMLAGNKAAHKRQISIRAIDNDEVNFDQATSMAIQFSFMGELLDWFLENKNWKEGGYIEVKANFNSN